jgi:hypothetical protein
MLKDANPGSSSGASSSYGSGMFMNFNGSLYFLGSTSGFGVTTDIFRTDGTPQGTVPIGMPIGVLTNGYGNGILGAISSGLIVGVNGASIGREPFLVVPGATANQAPSIDPVADQVMDINQTLTIQLNASDPDAGQTLTYSLGSFSSFASLNPATHQLTITPTFSGTFYITAVVTDSDSPAYYDSTTFRVVVNGPNQAPTLSPIADQAINVNGTLTIQAQATDPDLGQTLTYSLAAGAPAGASINPSTGLVSFQPPGLGSYAITVIVTDSGSPVLSDSTTFNVVATDNQAPVVDPVASQTAAVGQTLTIPITAADPDAGQTLTYSLVGMTFGASINPTTGVVTFSPLLPGTYQLTVKVADDGAVPLSVMTTFPVVVSATNQAPTIDSIADQTVGVNQVLTLTASAHDSDAGQILTYSLGAGAPSGASINASSGNITFQSAVTGSYAITVIATDNGTPALSASTLFNVVVVNTNHAPTVAAVADQTATVGQTLTVNLSATDPDAGQTLTYSLGAGAPAGAAINATTGVVTFLTSTAGTYHIPVVVTDSGTPALTATTTINVVAHQPNHLPSVQPIDNQTATVGQALTINVIATDPYDGQPVMYSLGDGAPAGASIDAATGVFTFTPSAAGMYTITIVVVADNGTQPVGVSNTFHVVATSANQAPTINPVAALATGVNRTLTIPITASDPDNGQTLTYSLGDGAPAGATIDAATGVVTYKPTKAGTYHIPVVARDSGTPALSASTTITVNAYGVVPQDFNGDGLTDYAVYRQSSGYWIVRQPTGGNILVGMGDPYQGDTAAPGDYDGDGKTDFAVYRPSLGLWVMRQSSGGTTFAYMGDPNQGDVAAPGDYDGDGKTDLAVYRPNTGLWIIHYSNGGGLVTFMGDPNQGDVATPGDYDGDGKTDLAVYRPSTGLWIVRGTKVGTHVTYFGDPSQGDVPAPADFDNDGLADFTVFRPSGALWISRKSSGGMLVTNMGDPAAKDVASNTSPYFQRKLFLGDPVAASSVSATQFVPVTTQASSVPRPSKLTTAYKPASSPLWINGTNT